MARLKPAINKEGIPAAIRISGDSEKPIEEERKTDEWWVLRNLSYFEERLQDEIQLLRKQEHMLVLHV